MAAHIVVKDVQQWLEKTKLTVDSVDEELEVTAFNVVASSLQTRYDTSSWVDPDTSPSMIKSIISMFVAGYLYNRQYSEDSNVSTYGSWLLRYASNLLNMVQSGEIDLADADALLNAWQYPQFWPTDVATDLADPKLGGDVNDPAGAPRAFSMGQIF